MSSGRCRSCAKISPKQINTTLKKDKAYRPPANTPAAASLRQLQTASSFTRTHHSIFASPLSSLTHSQSTELTPESRTDPCWKRFTIQFFVLLRKAIKLHGDNKVRQHKHKRAWVYAYLRVLLSFFKSYLLFCVLWDEEREGVNFQEYLVM